MNANGRECSHKIKTMMTIQPCLKGTCLERNCIRPSPAKRISKSQPKCEIWGSGWGEGLCKIGALLCLALLMGSVCNVAGAQTKEKDVRRTAVPQARKPYPPPR